MYEIRVQAEFAAAHAITIAGTPETMHGHNWLVEASITGKLLDSDGLLCDFHTVEDVLGEIIGPFKNQTLNAVSPFTQINPSAENVAR